MATENKAPETLQQAIRYFTDPDVCLAAAIQLRWGKGPVTCPTCGSTDVHFIVTRRIWRCSQQHERRQFSVKVGTIMEDSPIGLDKWMVAIWLLANAKNGISSYELHRAIGITQKSAWFMLHRIRLAMQAEDGGKIGGHVEVDETFIGGKSRNMHHAKRERVIKGTGGKGKVAVMGLLERYVDGQIHTNGCESFWSLLKRAIKGTYVSIEPFNLFRYLDEQCFRFNNRRMTDAQRFAHAATSIIGKRLTYRGLIGAQHSKSYAL